MTNTDPVPAPAPAAPERLSVHLSAKEVADLVDSPLPSLQIDWLTRNEWVFAISRLGKPKVSRAYHDQRMGVTTGRGPVGEGTDEPSWGHWPAK